MKVKLSIDQASKSGFLGGTTHSYKLNVQFIPNEKEKKIFNDHPLFQSIVFMEYAAGKKKDIPMTIKAKDIYEGKTIPIEANSVSELVEFHNAIDIASSEFVRHIDILSNIVGGKELIYEEN